MCVGGAGLRPLGGAQALLVQRIAAVASLWLFGGVAPWLDTRLALDSMPREVMDATQWAHAGTALALWMLLPLVIGIARITRREAAS